MNTVLFSFGYMGIHHTVLLVFGFERSHYANANKRRGEKEYDDKKENKKETHKKKNIVIKENGNR